MDDIAMNVDGVDEIVEAFQGFIQKYPDKAAELLVSQAKKLRRDVVKQVKNDTDTDGTSKKSLAKTSSYAISAVKGYGANQYIEISAKSPHFHLLENGHLNVVPRTRTIKKGGAKVKIKNPNGGQTVGFVPGYHFMDVAGRKRQLKIPVEVESLVNALLNQEGLT